MKKLTSILTLVCMLCTLLPCTVPVYATTPLSIIGIGADAEVSEPVVWDMSTFANVSGVDETYEGAGAYSRTAYTNAANLRIEACLGADVSFANDKLIYTSNTVNRKEGIAVTTSTKALFSTTESGVYTLAVPIKIVKSDTNAVTGNSWISSMHFISRMANAYWTNGNDKCQFIMTDMDSSGNFTTDASVYNSGFSTSGTEKTLYIVYQCLGGNSVKSTAYLDNVKLKTMTGGPSNASGSLNRFYIQVSGIQGAFTMEIGDITLREGALNSLSVKNGQVVLTGVENASYGVTIKSPNTGDRFAPLTTTDSTATITTDASGVGILDTSALGAGKYTVCLTDDETVTKSFYLGAESMLQNLELYADTSTFKSVMGNVLGLNETQANAVITAYLGLSEEGKTFVQTAGTESFEHFYAAVMMCNAKESGVLTEETISNLITAFEKIEVDTSAKVLFESNLITAEAVSEKLDLSEAATLEACWQAMVDAAVLCGVEAATGGYAAMTFLGYAGSTRYDGGDFDTRFMLACEVVKTDSYADIAALRTAINNASVSTEAVTGQNDFTKTNLLEKFEPIVWDMSEIYTDGYNGSSRVSTNLGTNNTVSTGEFRYDENSDKLVYTSDGGRDTLNLTTKDGYIVGDDGKYTIEYNITLKRKDGNVSTDWIGQGISWRLSLDATDTENFRIKETGVMDTYAGAFNYNAEKENILGSGNTHTFRIVYDNTGATTMIHNYYDDYCFYTMNCGKKIRQLSSAGFILSADSGRSYILELGDAILWKGGVEDRPSLTDHLVCNVDGANVSISNGDADTIYSVRLLKPTNTEGIAAFAETFSEEVYNTVKANAPGSEVCGFVETVTTDSEGSADISLEALRHGIYRMDIYKNAAATGAPVYSLYLYNRIGDILGESTIEASLNDPAFSAIYQQTGRTAEETNEILATLDAGTDYAKLAQVVDGNVSDLYAGAIYREVMEAGTKDENMIAKLKAEFEKRTIDTECLTLLAANNAYTDVVSAVDADNPATFGDAAVLMREAAILAGVKNAWGKDEVKTFLAVLGNTKYNGASGDNKDVIALAVMNQTYADLAALGTAIDGVTLPESGNNGGGGLSGGGGGGGGASIKKDPVDTGTGEVTEEETPNEGNNGESTAGGLYGDVSDSHWAYDSIKSMSEKGIISGYAGNFRPDDSVTRAEYVKMLCKLFGISEGQGNSFADVLASDWFAPFVYGAAECGLVNGNGTGFEPNGEITRQDAAVMLKRFMDFVKHEIEMNKAVQFDDEGSIAGYAVDAVKALSAMGIINGRENNNFAPLEQMTRAEAAKMLSFAVDR